MKHSAILRRIQQAARDDELRFTDHADDEMDAEGETSRSVAAVLRRARSVRLQNNGRWLVRGEGLVIILHMDESAVLVWTVYCG